MTRDAAWWREYRAKRKAAQAEEEARTLHVACDQRIRELEEALAQVRDELADRGLSTTRIERVLRSSTDSLEDIL